MTQSKLPEGWDKGRLRRVVNHYETQTEDDAIQEDEDESPAYTTMEVPVELVPAIRELIAKHRAS